MLLGQVFRTVCLWYWYGEDMEKRYSIDDKEIWFVKGDRYALIGDPDYRDETSTYQ